ncbi:MULTISPECIES: 16S rRNA (guanine(966)-N(2))-methyltransferase RsmD [unclassified Legionella]|uniref:16S rRNA (guanine(966)-N(2))-methyltransferase RsmD n=1 Tax=unclassified Legionella TaxID=2622702 RepID=UPI0010558995|nr:16S rRNA (guanine(966)-N(2))-methyltransferase RsmD [Legionella sp. W10-070]MDI9818682.1 16S rRNA (guanine(966)-N(2))-methyltransferase RsmD [Legionella sp. PL877]
MKQTVRIIGGRYRGKKISFPDIEGLRPTPDRVKETLFNWLMHEIRGANCLDAFAGSGALGFEAHSRGASHVVLIESSAKVYAHLKQTAALFNSPTINVIHGQAEDYFRNSKETFDIIFLDPPFAKNILPECLNLLAHSNLLVQGGLVYTESPDRLSLNPDCWKEKKFKQAGQVSYGLYEKS